MEVKLEHDRMLDNKFVCSITQDLDTAANINNSGQDLFHHYIAYDDFDLSNSWVVIRVPGGSLGYVKFDNNFTITEIVIDTKYVVKTYPRSINEEINTKYVGHKLILA